MKKYIYYSDNEALTEILNERFEMVCNEDMDIIITCDKGELEAYVAEVAPAAEGDYSLEEI